MNFEVKVFSTVDEKSWNQNLIKCHDSTIYQVPSYCKVYENTFDSKTNYIIIEDDNGKIVGQLVTLIHTKYYWRDSNLISKSIASKLHLNSILRWEYGPIIHPDTNKKEVFEKIISTVDKIAEENNVTMIRGTVCPLSDVNSEEIFERYGYNHTNWATYVTVLPQKPDDLYHKLSKETRYDIRKSENNDLELEIIDKFSTFEEYQELSFSSRIRAGEQRKRNHVFIKNFWENLYAQGFLKVFLVRKKGELLGAMESLSFNKNLLQYAVVNSPKTHMLGGTFLTWNALVWSMNNGIHTYDMGGINPNPETEKERSINFYKSKWGGTQLNYGRYVKIRNPTTMKLSAALSNPRRVSKKIISLFN